MESLEKLEKSVSHETLEKLKTYETLLKKWQKAINLVSKNTIEDAWNRHILDSLQIIKHLPKNENPSIVDLGSGGGFPPLVIAMCGYNNVSAIESDERKCFFMQEVANQTNTKIKVINERIEKVEKEDLIRHSECNEEYHCDEKILHSVQDDSFLGADFITSRALAKIDTLLKLSKDLSNPDTKYLFLKGKTANKEIEEAKKNFDFEAQTFQSMTSSEAKIVKITNLREKK